MEEESSGENSELETRLAKLQETYDERLANMEKTMAQITKAGEGLEKTVTDLTERLGEIDQLKERVEELEARVPKRIVLGETHGKGVFEEEETTPTLRFADIELGEVLGGRA